MVLQIEVKSRVSPLFGHCAVLLHHRFCTVPDLLQQPSFSLFLDRSIALGAI